MIPVIKSGVLGSLVLLIILPTMIHATNVKDYGAKGDGVADDYEAIMKTIGSSTDGVLEFPAGNYRITRTIHLQLDEVNISKIQGISGNSTLSMDGKGPAFFIEGTHLGSALPASVSETTWSKEKFFTIESIEIKGLHPEAEGVRLKNLMQPIISHCLIRNVSTGIHLVSRNRNVLLLGNHIYDCSKIGVFLDSVNIHQININDNHISYCKQGGIKVSNSEIRNIQIVGNDIEYNCDPEGPVSADIWVDCSRSGSVREGTISGNTIQAIPSPGGANIRFSGLSGNNNKIGLMSITGNHISNQEVNIELDHCRGVSISGNTFIRGYDRHLIVNDSRNVTISANVFDHNEDYFTADVDAMGGISIDKSQNILLSDNIIDGAAYKNGDVGGAVVITDSREISLGGCHIQNPKMNGVRIVSSPNVQITNCIIHEDMNPGEMQSGITLSGACPGTVVRANNISAGVKGAVVNNATGVRIEANVISDKGSK